MTSTAFLPFFLGSPPFAFDIYWLWLSNLFGNWGKNAIKFREVFFCVSFFRFQFTDEWRMRASTNLQLSIRIFSHRRYIECTNRILITSFSLWSAQLSLDNGNGEESSTLFDFFHFCFVRFIWQAFLSIVQLQSFHCECERVCAAHWMLILHCSFALSAHLWFREQTTFQWMNAFRNSRKMDFEWMKMKCAFSLSFDVTSLFEKNEQNRCRVAWIKSILFCWLFPNSFKLNSQLLKGKISFFFSSIYLSSVCRRENSFGKFDDTKKCGSLSLTIL